MLPVGIASHLGLLIVFWSLVFSFLALCNLFGVSIFNIGNWRLYRGDMTWGIYGCALLGVPWQATLATLYLGFYAGIWLHVFITMATIVPYPLFLRHVRFLIRFVAIFFLAVVVVIAICSGSIYVESAKLSAVLLLMILSVLAFVVMVVIASYDVTVERTELAQQVEEE